MVTAQDKALAALCVERGLLDDAAIERARQAHASALSSGGAPPLGQLLVQGGFLNPRLASDLLRELALSVYRCNKCNRSWSYEALSKLGRYRCDGCGERLARMLARTPTGRFVAASRPEATEVLPRGLSRGSSVSRLPTSQAHQVALSIAAVPPTGAGPAPSGPAPTPGTGEGVLEPGKRIGPYEVVSELGRGAMGIVYLARRPGLERSFAIKVLLGGLLADNEAVERFRREASLASRVQHPAIVGVCDVGVVGGLHYYVMDYCAGRTLKAVLAEKQRYPVAEAVELVAKIAEGVAAAHALGIVHRDLKPANIIMDAKTNEPRIMDFGLARDASSSEVGMTRTGDIVGTPSYSSPEQLTGKKDVDARVDVYALGVVLYELIAGTRPFHADTVAHLAAIVLTEDPQPLGTHVADVPTAIDAVIAKAMAKQPAGRYRTAAELADDLKRFLRGEPVSARPERRLARLWRRRRATILALALLAPLGAAGIGAAIWAARNARAQAAQRAVDKLRELEHVALQGEPLTGLADSFALLTSQAPASVLPRIEVAWASILHRRDHDPEALPLVARHVDDPGPQADEAKRILAEIDLEAGKTADAARLIAALAASKNRTYSDWALLRGVVDGSPPGAGLGAARQRVADDKDPSSIRLLAALEMREKHETKAIDVLRHVTDEIARDDCAAHLALAGYLRAKRTAAELRSGQEDIEARKHVAEYERFGGDAKLRRPLAQIMLAETAIAQKDFEAAIQHADAALALDGDSVEANALRSWYPDEQGRKSYARAAKANAERTRDLAPDTPAVLAFSRVVSPAAAKRIEAIVAEARPDARDALRKALRASAEGAKTPEVAKAFDEAARSGGPIALREKARFLVSRCQVGAAREAIQAARQNGADEGDMLLLEVALDVRDQVVDRAVEAADQLERLGPNDRRTLIARALIAGEEHESNALDLAKNAVAAAPCEGLAHIALASACSAADDFEGCVLAARTALFYDARLDEEAELQLLKGMLYVTQRAQGEDGFRALAAVFGFRGPGRGGFWRGPRGEGHGDREPSREPRDEDGPAARLLKLETEIPSARLFYVRSIFAINMLSRAQSEMRDSRRGPGMMVSILNQELNKAIEADDKCPLGFSAMGLAHAILMQTDATRDDWSKAKIIDARWRPPQRWKNLITQKYVIDEFTAKAPR